MEIGIIGPSQSGKTTIFNALTSGHARVELSSATSKPNVGVAKVPDPRLDRLAEVFQPERAVPAEVTYVDVPGAPEGLGQEQGIGGAFLNHLQRADALLHVVRAFQDPSVPHVAGSVDPYRDIATVDLELLFSDLAILERRLRRLETEIKGAKPQQREAASRERRLLEHVKGLLEDNTPIRAQDLDPEEAPSLSHYQFLTAKPLLVALNIDEEQLTDAPRMEEELASRIEGTAVRGMVLCGKLEAELSEMEEADEAEFRDSLGVGESGPRRIVRLSQEALGVITFFTTVGRSEVRAWTIPEGTPAVKAAGKIHSDMERGFVRAEVVRYRDLVECGGMAEARKRGLLRVEGKDHPILDGDVVHILFNV